MSVPPSPELLDTVSLSPGLGCSSPRAGRGSGKHSQSTDPSDWSVAVYSSPTLLDLKKIFTRKRQSITFRGETNADGGGKKKKRALIRPVSVLLAAFHPQISNCFNMTELSLFYNVGNQRKRHTETDP